MKFKPVSEIKDFLQPFAEKEGVEIVDVEVKIGKEPSLTVLIETELGVDLDTLERFHNAINDPLDEFDPSFDAPYTLNVSSPGLDRAFKTDRDFERNLGKEVEVKLYAPIKGEKFIEGELTFYDGKNIVVKTKKEEIKLELNRIAKINKAIKFE